MHACVCIYTFIFYWGIEDKLMQWVLKKCLFWIDCSLQHEWVIEVICGRREQCVSKIHGWCWLPTFSCNDSTTQAANCNPDFLVNRVHTSESIHSKVNGSRGIMKWNDAVSIKKINCSNDAWEDNIKLKCSSQWLQAQQCMYRNKSTKSELHLF